MIPLIVFVALALMLIPLFLYAFIDHRNKLYANIIAAFLCALIAAYLAVVISVGIVQYDPTITFSGLSWVNTSTYDDRIQDFVVTNVSSSVCNTCNGVPIKDASVGYILTLFSIIMMIYTLYMIYEAYDEYKQDKMGGRD
jgi:hypothetical protein